MIELSGKYGTAKVFTDVVDNESISQVINLLNQPYVQGSKVRMMPDIHAGAGCTIGTTMTISDKICPNLVGVDIGCGMNVARIREDHIDLKKLDEVIRREIPSGFSIHSQAVPEADLLDLASHLRCRNHVDIERAKRSIGTLGGGNHFIEANMDDEGHIYIVIHSGSRHLGLEVANYYQEEAYKQLTQYSKAEIDEVIESLKAAGRKNEIQSAIEKLRGERKHTPVPKPLAYVQGSLFDDYLNDMQVVQRFARLNRYCMMRAIINTMDLHCEDGFTTTHNYIDVGNMILRKGSVSAHLGERFIIPINMRDGSLLCTGKGNPDWNYSAPHGAGRLMSRSAAKEAFTVDEFAKQMEGIYTTSVGQSTLDECPMAYKGMDDIVNNIGPTAQIDAIIKPIYNFKAGD
jgi:RNA-splicing ligase RtcB